MTSHLCPFRYREFPRPSIFATDPHVVKGAVTGKTMGSLQSDAMGRYEENTGRSAGTIYGISDKADKQAASRAPRKRAGGHYAGGR
jgi:hypothetical protein